jgi:hypothetical protein
MESLSNDGTNYEQWKLIAIATLMKVAKLDKETATANYEGGEDFYKDCYDDNLSPEDAVSEDISNWEEG